MGVLSSQAKPANQAPIARHILTGEVVEQLPPPTYKPEEAYPCVRVFAVYPEVIGKIPDPSGEESHLDFYGTCITFTLAVFSYDLRLFVFVH